MRKGHLTKTRLSEVGTWPKLGCQKWSPDQNLSVRYGHLTNTCRWDYGTLFIGQVTIFHRQVLVRLPLLTAEFWSGTHFWQPSFGSVTISHRLVLDRVRIFHRRLLWGFWDKADNKAKGYFFWSLTPCSAHIVPGHFLHHTCQDSSYWHHPIKAVIQD